MRKEPALAGLDAAAWAAVPEPRRSVIRCYYGLEGGRPSQRELARECGLPMWQVQYWLRGRPVRRLVRAGAHVGAVFPAAGPSWPR